jgi:hypothetical protein
MRRSKTGGPTAWPRLIPATWFYPERKINHLQIGCRATNRAYDDHQNLFKCLSRIRRARHYSVTD